MILLILCYDKLAPLTARSFPQFDVVSPGNDIFIMMGRGDLPSIIRISNLLLPKCINVF